MSAAPGRPRQARSRRGARTSDERLLVTPVSLTRKEFAAAACAIRSSLAIGILLPMVLILIFGYGLSLDVKNAPRGRGDGGQPRRPRTKPSRAYQLSPYHLAGAAGFHARRRGCFCASARSTASCAFRATSRSRAGRGRCARIQLDRAWRGCQQGDHHPGATCQRLRSARRPCGRPTALGSTSAAQCAANGIGRVTVEPRMWFNSREHQHLVPGAGAGRAHHDAGRRLPHRAGDGARMGARHARGACSSRPCAQWRYPAWPRSFRISASAWLGLALCLLAARFLFAVPMVRLAVRAGVQRRCST
jgi:ABC-2 type transport system permease protein